MDNPAKDLISRQEAVDALDKLDYTPGEWAIKGLTMCKDAIKAVPSAQPEQKVGHWIDKFAGEYRCSNCRNTISLGDEILMSIKGLQYCPYCGSHNGGE